MLPYEDQPQPEKRSTPFVTILLILINIAVFVYELSLGQAGAESFSLRWGFVPSEFWSGQDLHTLITAQFLHGGLLHIAGNMIFLWVFGDNVEDQLGHWTYLFFYLAAGVVASITFAVAFPDANDPLVGASGAIAGVLGGYLLLFPRAVVRAVLSFGPFITIGTVAAVIMIGFWFLLQVIQSVVALLPMAPQSNVAFLAHVGGFVFGLVTTGLIRQARGQEVVHDDNRPWWSASFRNWVLLSIVVTLLVLGSQVILGGGLSGQIVRFVIGATVVSLAFLDGVARLTGRSGLLGSPRANKGVALLQIFAALSLAATLFAI